MTALTLFAPSARASLGVELAYPPPLRHPTESAGTAIMFLPPTRQTPHSSSFYPWKIPGAARPTRRAWA